MSLHCPTTWYANDNQVVKYPTSGKPWRMGRKLVNQWLANGVLRLEGYIPDLALVEG